MKIFDYADLGNKHSWDYTEKGITPEAEGISPICETDIKIQMGDLLIIDDVAYCICSMSGRGSTEENNYNTCYVEKLKDQDIFINGEDPEDKYYTSNITCPYCGFENQDSWEASEDEEEEECSCCGSTFSYQRNVTVEYCGQPVKKNEAIIVK